MCASVIQRCWLLLTQLLLSSELVSSHLVTQEVTRLTQSSLFFVSRRLFFLPYILLSPIHKLSLFFVTSVILRLLVSNNSIVCHPAHPPLVTRRPVLLTQPSFLPQEVMRLIQSKRLAGQ